MALAAFTVFMLGCAALKDWVVSRRQDRSAAPPPAAPAFAVQ
jgi:hypothetical protein